MGVSRKLMLGAVASAMVLTAPMPVFAADLSVPATAKSADGSMASTAEYWGRRRWRHRDRIDGGDVLAGIGILAGIAIIADAASKSDGSSRRRDRDEDYPVYRNQTPDRYENSGSSYSGNDMGSAVNACSSAAERSAGGSARVQEIRSVTRDGQAWRVDGLLDGGASRGFSCAATNGQVDFVRLNDGRI